MKQLHYYLVYGTVYLISLLPFWMLYGISSCLYPIVYYIIRYRRKIVRSNLTSSFPEKDLKEIKRIERKFYQWFCDYIFETFKLLTISHEKLKKRNIYHGLEQLEERYDQGQDCATILGHYCNWEWHSAINLGYSRYEDTAIVGLIYHQLRSEAVDKVFFKIRSSHKGTPVNKNLILRHIVNYKKENQRNMFGYISDQAPKWDNIHLWLPFLNHPETPVFTGGERIMRKMNNAVYYLDMRRVRRGYYETNVVLITENAKDMPENAISQRFFEMLEESIRREPQYYLWTHNRWKRTKEEWERRMAQKNH